MTSQVPSASGTWFDISTPIHNGMVVWPGDPPVLVQRAADVGKGDSCTLSSIAMSAHAGTHIDAPLHLLAGHASMDDMPLDAVVGPARVLEIAGPQAIDATDLAAFDIQPGERILLKTGNSHRSQGDNVFVEDFVALSPGGAEHLVERGIRTVGIDSLSIGRYGSEGDRTHKILMQAGIWIIEGLDLRRVAAGSYDLICLPLRLLGAEGAPARAVLRKRIS